MLDIVTVLGALIPFVIALLLLFGRIENRLSRIETDISWIKKELNSCPPRLANPTP